MTEHNSRPEDSPSEPHACVKILAAKFGPRLERIILDMSEEEQVAFAIAVSEPMVPLEVVSVLYPVSVNSILQILSYYPEKFGPPVFGPTTNGGQVPRLLTLVECRTIRDMVILERIDNQPYRGGPRKTKPFALKRDVQRLNIKVQPEEVPAEVLAVLDEEPQ